MVGLQTLDLAIGVRVPASQPQRIKHLRAAQELGRPFLYAYWISGTQVSSLLAAQPVAQPHILTA